MCNHPVVSTRPGRVTCEQCQKDLAPADLPSHSWLFVDLERRLQREDQYQKLDDLEDECELKRFNRYADLKSYADLVR